MQLKETGLFDVWTQQSLEKYLYNLFINYVYFSGKQSLQIITLITFFDVCQTQNYSVDELYSVMDVVNERLQTVIVHFWHFHYNLNVMNAVQVGTYKAFLQLQTSPGV